MAARVGARKISRLAFAATIALAVAVFGRPGERVQLWMLTIGIAAGLPHGALDVLTAEGWLKPRLGGRWLSTFILMYLCAGAVVVALWAAAPALALISFLALASIHFGEALAPVGPLRPFRTFAHGLAPIIVPTLAYPHAVAVAFTPLAGDANAGIIVGALAGPVAFVWLPMVVGAVVSRAPIVDLTATVLIFVALPPLPAFAVYFAGLHGSRAVGEIARARGRPVRELLETAAPFVALAIVLIALGYAFTAGSLDPSPALIRALFVGLAALAVPHLLLGWVATPAFDRSPRTERAHGTVVR